MAPRRSVSQDQRLPALSVATDLPQVRAFNDEHDIPIVSPNRTAEFLASIRRALALPSGDAVIAHRRGVTELSDWDKRIDE
jgi:hypothetical protein